MAKIIPVDTGWFAGTGGKIGNNNGPCSGWQISQMDDRIGDMSKKDPYCDGITRGKMDDKGNERIFKRGSDTGFFFSHDFSIIQDDDKGSIGDLFK